MRGATVAGIDLADLGDESAQGFHVVIAG